MKMPYTTIEHLDAQIKRYEKVLPSVENPDRIRQIITNLEKERVLINANLTQTKLKKFSRKHIK